MAFVPLPTHAHQPLYRLLSLSNLTKNNQGKNIHWCKARKKTLFGAELETKLVDYASNRAALGIGFEKKTVSGLCRAAR